MLTHLALLLAGQAPATVTHTCPATKLELVVEEIAKQTGESLKISSVYEGRFMVVRFKATPLESALDRIAKSLNAVWAKSGSSKVLQPDPKHVAPEADGAFKKAIRDYIGTVDSIKTWNPQDADRFVSEGVTLREKSEQSNEFWQQIQKFSNRSPKSRMMKRLAKAIGATTLGKLKVGERWVFSSHPTKMQQPLPTGSPAIFSDYMLEESYREEALEKKGIGRDSEDHKYYVEALIPRYEKNFKPSTVYFSLKRAESGLQIDGIMRNGTEYCHINDHVSMYQETAVAKTTPLIQVDGDYAPSKKTDLVGRAAARSLSGGRSKIELTPEEDREVLSMFFDLEKHELLQLAPSEILLQTAETLDKDLVCAMSDSGIIVNVYSRAMWIENKTLSLSQIFEKLSMLWSLYDAESGITLSTNDDFYGIRFVWPRKSVSSFVKSVSKSGLEIEPLADLVGVFPKSDALSMTLSMAVIPFPGLIESMRIGNEGLSTLRIYAKLDQAARAKAKSGGYKAKFGSLTPAVQNEIRDYFYNEAMSVSESNGARDEDRRFYQLGFSGDRDVTTLYPDGIPFEAVVTIKSSSAQKLFTVNEFGSGYQHTQSVSEEEMASQLAWNQKTNGQPGYSHSMKIGTGVLKQLDLVIELSPKDYVQDRFELRPKLKPDQIGDVSILPEAQRKSLEEKIAKQLEQLKDVQIGPQRPTKIKP